MGIKKEKDVDFIVRERLLSSGYGDQERFIINTDSVDNKVIQDVLNHSSKKNNGKIGFPDFIVQSKQTNTIIVIESKHGVDKHELSPDTTGAIIKAASNGAIWYGQQLSEIANVVAIGFSKDNKNQKVSTYYLRKGTKDHFDLNVDEIVPFSTLEEKISILEKKNSITIFEDESKLKRFAESLNEFMRDYTELEEEKRALLAASILVALKDSIFKISFPETTNTSQLAKLIYEYVINNVKILNLGRKEREAIISTLEFLKIMKDNDKGVNEYGGNSLKKLVIDFKENIFVHLVNKDYDVVGLFFTSFLKYATKGGGDLGVVLTPDHIATLFTKLAKINGNSRVIDPTMGTGTFLVKSWKEILSDSKINANGIENMAINKPDSLGGIEIKPVMFTLAYLNLILHGDGDSKFVLGSLHTAAVQSQMKNKFNVGLINPPYSHGSAPELVFVEEMMDLLLPKSIAVAIIPINSVSGQNKKHGSLKHHKERILKKHNLIASIQMPPQLFYPKGTETVVLVFRTNEENSGKTWFASYDDGYKVIKQRGRVPFANTQEKLENIVDLYNKKAISDISFNKEITFEDQWIFNSMNDASLKFDMKEYIKTLKEFEVYNFMVKDED